MSEVGAWLSTNIFATLVGLFFLRSIHVLVDFEKTNKRSNSRNTGEVKGAKNRPKIYFSKYQLKSFNKCSVFEMDIFCACGNLACFQCSDFYVLLNCYSCGVFLQCQIARDWILQCNAYYFMMHLVVVIEFEFFNLNLLFCFIFLNFHKSHWFLILPNWI